MGQRVYKTYFENVTVAAVQDLFLLKAGSVNGIELHQIDLSAGGVTAPAEIRLRLKVLPATVTNGSGGTAPVMSPSDSGDTKAATGTVRSNDTTQATSSGTVKILQAHQWNVLLPWQYLPAPEDREMIQATEAIVLDIAGTPASTIISGAIAWRELP
jgi:hypothetical protein